MKNGRKLKIFYKEFFLLPICLFIIMLAIDSIRDSNITYLYKITNLFFSFTTIPLGEMKTFFIAYIILMVFELIIYVEVEDNFVISKVLTLLFIETLIFFCYCFIPIYNKVILYILRLIFIYFGQFVVFLLSRKLLPHKNDIIYTGFLLLLMMVFLTFYNL